MNPIHHFLTNSIDISSGLNADEKAIVAQNCLVTVVSTGSAVRDGEGVVEVVGSTPETLQNQMADHMQSTDIKVVKIGQEILLPENMVRKSEI